MNIQGEQLECNKALIDKYRSEYLLLPEKERKQHTCISFLTFIFTGNAVPYLDPNLWQGEECKIEDIKEGDAIVFSRCKESNINHCVICIAQGRFLSKEYGDPDLKESDFLDIIEKYENTRYIEKIKLFEYE